MTNSEASACRRSNGDYEKNMPKDTCFLSFSGNFETGQTQRKISSLCCLEIELNFGIRTSTSLIL